VVIQLLQALQYQMLTEEYDGSTWTAGGNLGTATGERFWRCRNSNSRFSFWWIYTNAPVATATEEYDGIILDSWRNIWEILKILQWVMQDQVLKQQL
jgi:hypothetical protein